MGSKKSRRRKAKRRAVAYLAKDRRCSYAVAGFILACMPTDQRKRYINRFKLLEK